MEQAASDRRSSGAHLARQARVLIVDDDAVVCSFVQKILEHEGHKVKTAASVLGGREALHAEFDVAVIDVDLPDGEGFELVDLVRDRFARPIPIVLITGNPNDDYLDKSVSQGIVEFLFKPFHAKDVRAAVERAVQARARWEARVGSLPESGINRTASTQLAAKPIPPSEIGHLTESLARLHGLTERERQTLGHMLAGLQNVDIASALEISANTVKYHVRNVLTKLGMESRTELFRSLLNRRK